MAEVDTSSYPKPVAGQTPLDIAGKLGSLQSQKLDIDQKKLSQANEALTYLTRGLNSLGPNPTKQQLVNMGQNLVNMNLAPPAMVQTMNAQIPDDPAKMPAFVDQLRTQTAEHKDMMDYHLGNIRKDSTGANDVFSQVPGNPRAPIIQRGQLELQEPPTQGTVDPITSQSRTYGGGRPSPGIVPVGRLGAISPPLPAGAIDPSTMPRSPFQKPGETPVAAEAMPPTTTRTAQGVPTGAPPGFDEGLKQYTGDQEIATQKMTALKPLLLALPKMKDLRSGPGTETFNNAVAFLKANGILPTQADNKDPTQIYQEVNKYMNQYVSRNGTRSDADLASREMSNPNVKTQINPALIELTQNTIAQDRIESSRPNAFESRDYSRYGQHRSQFPQNQSIDAAKFDLTPGTPEQKDKEIDRQWKKAQAGDKSAIKFIKTLDTMRKQKMHDYPGE